MIGKTRGEAPLGVRALLAIRRPPHRLALGRNDGELEREQPAQRGFLVGIGLEELLRASREHAADIDRLRRQPQLGVAARDHGGPHVGQEIGEKRQCARRGGGGIGDADRDLVILEADAERGGGRGHDRVQLRAIEGRHVDVRMASEQRFVRLQLVEVVGPQAGEGEQARIGKTLAQQFGEAARLRRRSAGVELLALVEVEQKPSRRFALPLPDLFLRGADEIGELVFAGRESLHPFSRQRSLVGILRIELPQPREGVDQRLERRLPRPRRQQGPAPAALERGGPRRFRRAVGARPAHGFERGQHPRLRDRGFADAGGPD